MTDMTPERKNESMITIPSPIRKTPPKLDLSMVVPTSTSILNRTLELKKMLPTFQANPEDDVDTKLMQVCELNRRTISVFAANDEAALVALKRSTDHRLDSITVNMERYATMWEKSNNQLAANMERYVTALEKGQNQIVNHVSFVVLLYFFLGFYLFWCRFLNWKRVKPN